MNVLCIGLAVMDITARPVSQKDEWQDKTSDILNIDAGNTCYDHYIEECARKPVEQIVVLILTLYSSGSAKSFEDHSQKYRKRRAYDEIEPPQKCVYRPGQTLVQRRNT